VLCVGFSFIVGFLILELSQHFVNSNICAIINCVIEKDKLRMNLSFYCCSYFVCYDMNALCAAGVHQEVGGGATSSPEVNNIGC